MKYLPAILAGITAIAGAEGCTDKPQAQSPQLSAHEGTVRQGARDIHDRVYEEIIKPCDNILGEKDSTIKNGARLEVAHITVTSGDGATTCTYFNTFDFRGVYALSVSTPEQKVTTVSVYPLQIILMSGEKERRTVDSVPVKDKLGIYQHACTVTELGKNNLIDNAPMTVAGCSVEIADMRAMGASIVGRLHDKIQAKAALVHSEKSQ